MAARSYRKKPVVIEAVQWDGERDTFSAIRRMAGQHNVQRRPISGLVIETLEGEMRANPGDWIIRGVKGEIYPCKPDVFAETYEPAD